MNEIEKILKKIGSNKVDWVKLGDVCTFTRGKPLSSSDTIPGDVPVVSGGQKPSFYHNRPNRVRNTITVAGSGASAGFVSYWEIPIWVADAFTVDPYEKLTLKYVYYFLKNNQEKIYRLQKGAGVPHVHGNDIAGIKIPVPRVPIQNWIVLILDSFTTLIDKMKQEVVLRKKQMEYYREKLLSFEGEECDWNTLKELFVIKNGLNKEKKDFGIGTPIINYVDVYKNRGLHKDDIKGLVNSNESELSRFKCTKGDVFFTRTSETKEEVGFPSVLLDDIENCVFSGFLLKATPITDKLDAQYCKYCFFTNQFRQEVEKRATLTTRALTNSTSLYKISIPVPSPSTQRSIVSILDTFEQYISKLERLITLREKQYAYYREKLLTFE